MTLNVPTIISSVKAEHGTEMSVLILKELIRSRAYIRIRKWGDGLLCKRKLFQLGSGGRCKPPAGSGAEPRRQTHFGKNLLQINLKSGLFSVVVYTAISDPISGVHWLVRRKIGSAVRGCAKLVDIQMLNIDS